MSRKLPIRTYARRNAADKGGLVCGTSSFALRGQKSSNSPEIKNTNNIVSNENDSLDYDPFDTTFDRLARNARLPPAPVNNEEHSWLSSSNNTSRDEVAGDNDSVLRVSIELSKRSRLKPSRIKTQNKSSHRCIIKRKVPKQLPFNSKRKKLTKSTSKTIYSSNGIKKLHNDTSKQMEQEQKEQIGIKQLAENINISTLTINEFSQKEKSENSVNWYLVENNAMDVLNIKPCSVKLQDLYKDKENVKCVEKVGKSIQNTILLNHNSELGNDTKLKLNYYKSETISLYTENKVQHCFVKLERLDGVCPEEKVFGKSTADAVCSTPMHKHKSKGLHSLLLSPIPIYHNEKCVISKEPVNNGSRNESDKSLISLKPNDTDINSYVSKKQSRSIKSIEMLYQETSLTELMSIKHDEDHSCYNQLKHVVNKECILEEYDLLSTQKCLKTVDDGRNNTGAIPLSSRSESLMEDSKSDIKSSFSIQNSQHSESDMFSQTGTSSSLMCESTANQVSRDESCANFTCEDHTGTMEAKSSDGKETHNTQLALRGNKNNLESILSGTLSIEIQESQNDSGQMENEKSISLLELSSQQRIENTSFQQLRVVLQRLQDPVRITNRRKQYRKWTLALSRISGENDVPGNITNISESIKENAILPKSGNEDKSVGNTSILKADLDLTSCRSKKSFYLKPGKSWTRSLSILNNIQNGIDADGVPQGKGKKWSHSVKDVLSRQKEGIVESSFKQSENINRESLQIPITKLNDTCNTKPCTITLGRISTRMSVRVVQTGMPTRNTDDASFLEAYGILPMITGARRSTSNIPRRTFADNTDPTTNLSQLTANYSELKAKDAVLNRCKQKDYLPFAKYFSASYVGCCTKIGEGVYGEVFLHEDESNKSVIKIIPIEGTESVNGEPQKKFGEILSEIVIAMELHNLRFSSTHWTDSFVNVQSIKCVKGKYPDKLIELWKLYDDEKGSDNDCPAMFSENQLYITLELGHGGQDLEGYVFRTAEQALAAFEQAAVTLAVAENALQFEHRDLHWGNLLISNTNEKSIYYKLLDKEFRIPTKGVKVSIIDFTLSRMSYENCCIFNDLALDPALFTAQGDYQFEIYRLMRDTIGNQWEKFEPYTNILWLHYTLDKMITEVRYKKVNLKTHKNAISKLVSVKNQILDYESAYDFVTNCDIFAKVQRTNLR